MEEEYKDKEDVVTCYEKEDHKQLLDHALDLTMSTSDQSPRRDITNKNRKFSDFKIIKMIGTGTFGKVYLGLLEGQPVAIKCLKKNQIIKMK